MSSRGRRRAPARHAKPRSISGLIGPLTVVAVLVLGGSAATGTTGFANANSGSETAASKSVSGVTRILPNTPGAIRTTRTVTAVKKVAVTSKIIHSAEVERGTKLLRSKGTKGTVKYVYQVRVLQGKQIAKTLVSKKVLNKGKPAVYIVGTGKPVALTLDAKAAAAGTGTPEGNMKFAQVYIAKKYDWNQTQYGCLVSLWDRESHWRHTARNRGSGAYGIPQAMPGDKMSKFGADWQTNPITQIKWGANYIEKRYNTPCGALEHSNSTGWY